MRRTKIICTLGPACENKKMLKEMMKAGMNVARMNFSHGSHEEHQKRLDVFKKARDEIKMPVALLLDTKGPEIRTGKIKDDAVLLKDGENFIIYFKDVKGDEKGCSLSYKNLYLDVEPGGKILIDDGLVALKVDEVKDKDIYCTVLNGGTIGTKKGVNVPNAKIKLPSLTKKDVEDIKFAVRNDMDFIAASFVRKAQDILEIRKILKKSGGSDIKIIAKIENQEGIDNFDEILKHADSVMVARGDLGVEIPVEEVPTVQKELIKKCFANNRNVITATQMLDSMIRNPRPTRAEASDVANAICDGTSAIMLSGETAVGKYPVESIKTMARIAEATENSINYWNLYDSIKHYFIPSPTYGICHAAFMTACDLRAAAIVVVTASGQTAKMISGFRPMCPILVTTPDSKVQRQLSISWGINAQLVSVAKNTDELFETSMKKVISTKTAKKGDVVVIIAGSRTGVSGSTNTLKVEVIE